MYNYHSGEQFGCESTITKVMIDKHLKTHIWISDEPREIKIEGESIFHHHCRQCGRDFAREASQADWRAVYIGPFSVKFLDDSATQQWVSEPCPGSPSPIAPMPMPSKKRSTRKSSSNA
jgi:hypothetical protein